MSLHAIEQFAFEFWRGDPPGFYRKQVETFTRAGTNGTAAKTLGRRGTTFTAELESWFPSYNAARSIYPSYLNLIATNPVRAKYNDRDYFTLHRTKFLVEDIVEVDCRTNVRLLGPGIDYAGGATLVTRWTMTPIFVG